METADAEEQPQTALPTSCSQRLQQQRDLPVVSGSVPPSSIQPLPALGAEQLESNCPGPRREGSGAPRGWDLGGKVRSGGGGWRGPGNPFLTGYQGGLLGRCPSWMIPTTPRWSADSVARSSGARDHPTFHQALPQEHVRSQAQENGSW